MENLAHAIRQLQSGALSRAEFFAELERAVAAAPASAARLLESLSEEHARAPLPPALYAEVQRRIEAMLASLQGTGGDATSVQTQPASLPAMPFSPSMPPRTPGDDTPTEPERMKAVGDTLNGRFVLEECIGFGGMGTVYKALDLRKLEAADRKPYIAIKVLNVQFRGHPKSLVALQREARKAQTLAHPNIVSVYDFDRDGQVVYLTMEYLSGKSLGQILRAAGFTGLPYAEVMRIAGGMGRALAYAHERGFVHCDFKPANVILTDAGNIKVIDFGIARVFQKAEEEVDATVFDPGSLGALTPAYASPEMLEQQEPDPRDDIYALACIVYELLTGRHPYGRMSALQARAAGLKPQRPAGLSRARWRGLQRGLSLDRATRTPTVARFLSQVGEPRRASHGAQLAVAGMGIVLLAVAAVAIWRGGAPAGDQSAAQRITPASPAPPASGTAPGSAVPPVTATPSPASAPAAPSAQAALSAPSASSTPSTASASSASSAPAASPAAVEPLPSPDVVTSRLAGIACSALAASMHGQSLLIQGYAPRRLDGARLRALAAPGASAAAIELDVQPVDDSNCAPINVFAPYWRAHRSAGDGAAIRLSGTHASDNQLTEGDPLMVDVTSAGAESWVMVDYYEVDGSVVHLLPNLRARENRAPPRYTATIGSLGNWVIGKPFGHEVVVLITTPTPLFDRLRPETEPAAAYLRAVGQRLAQMSAGAAPGSIGVDFVQISTRARQH